MTVRTIETETAPKAVGAYSQGRYVDGWIITSGQVGLDPASGELVQGDVEREVRQALNNVLAVVEAGGGHRESVVKTTVFLTNLDHYDVVNAAYRDVFGSSLPARSVVEVRSLPAGASVEIEAMARRVE